MIFSLFNIFFDILIIILLVRFFIEPYRFYGFGPLMTGVITITEKAIAPLRTFLPRTALTLQDRIPLAAVVIVILLRGLFIWIFGAGLDFTVPGVRITGFFSSLVSSLAISATMAILLIGKVLIALLFASLMISRRGLSLYGNAGFACFQEKTFAIFQKAKTIGKTENLTALFLISSSVILLLTALLASFSSLSFLQGFVGIQKAFLLSIFNVMIGLLNFYWMVLLVAIIASWVAADRFSTMVQVVQSMTEPYLSFFRRLMPWARIDFIDLSPIFAFLALSLVIMLLQNVAYKMAIMGSIQSSIL